LPIICALFYYTTLVINFVGLLFSRYLILGNIVTLKFRPGSHSLCEVRHTLLKSTDARLSFCCLYIQFYTVIPRNKYSLWVRKTVPFFIWA